MKNSNAIKVACVGNALSKRIPLSFMLFLLFLLPLSVQGQLPKSFSSVLKRAEMIFEMPENYVEAEIIDNRHMQYDYAIKHPEKKFEIRYAIRPMDVQLLQYNEYKKKGATVIHPNNFYPAVAMTVALNVAKTEPAPLSEFPTDAVKNEFNADKGCTTGFDVKSDFATGYKYCMMVVIQKDNIGTAYYFYLAEDSSTIMECMASVFHSLRFRE